MEREKMEAIARLRKQGCGYKSIAKFLDMNESTVKTFCRRNGLRPVDLNKTADRMVNTDRFCKNCGAELHQRPKGKKKKFCCDRCRNTWWNSHLDEVNRKAIYDFVCPTCGKEFHVYGDRNRKYCSHPCYIKARFGTSRNTEQTYRFQRVEGEI